ncbi:MAG: DEAD/DEAH box helicase family protein [Spirochaetales bacterium]|nr:DEAD/DEAH box helicase family protein [Spirochaetales bacterium]
MRYPQVLKYVGKLIYERGLNYYNKEMIEEFTLNNKLINATVRGSLKNRYKVNILIDDNDEVHHADCDCPYWSRCKHIAAVLIRYFNEKNGKIIALPHILPELDLKEKEKIYPLSFENLPSREIRLFCKDIEQQVNYSPVDDGKLWKIVFKIRKQKFEFNENIQFTLSPALQYIKKNGSTGNIYNYTKNRVYSCSDEENEILQKLLCTSEQKDSFFSYLDHFVNNKSLQLYYMHKYKTIPIERCELKKMVLTFELIEIRHDEVLFSPILTFHGENNKVSSTKNISHYPINGGTIFSILSTEGTLFYRKNCPEFAYFVQNIMKKKYLYTPSDIQYLKLHTPSVLAPMIDIQFDARTVSMIDVQPSPIIGVRSLFGGRIDINISFDYMDNEINYNEEDGFIIHKHSGKNITVIRKRNVMEKEILQAIHEYVKDYIPEGYYSNNPSRFQIDYPLYTFLTELGPSFIEKGFRLRIGKEKTLKKHSGAFRYAISSNIDWFNLDIFFVDDNGNKVHVDINLEDLHQGIGKIGDSYLLLNKEDCEKLKQLLSSCRKDKKSLRFSKFDVDVVESLYQDAATIRNEEMTFLYSTFSKLQNSKEIPEYNLPLAFTPVLRNYQKAGYYWLRFLHETNLNGCLADDMGLGKTVQALALLENLKEANNLSLSLLVVPVTTFANWENEMKRFAPNLRVIRHSGRKRPETIEVYSEYDIILLSYHTLRNDIGIFTTRSYDYLILDESQSIKNAFSKTFKAIKILKAKHKLSLTGTPVENNTLELWAQMDFLNPGILGSYNEFKNKFTKPIEEYGNEKASAKLKKIVYPFILRRKKEDVLDDLPEKEIIYKYVEMNSLQKEAYLQVSQYYKEKIRITIEHKGLKKSSIEIIEALLRLRQMVLFPFLVSQEYAHINSSKFDLLKEMLEEILEEKHKVLIFSQFVQVLRKIEEYINGVKIPYTYIDGSTKHRSKQIEEFQKNNDISVFLLSLKAGGIGINLTAADYVILFDPWWNPAIEQQAIDRSHRIGQKQKVIAFKIIVKDSIEEKIITLQNRKEDLVKSIVMNEKNIFKSFDENEILSFFDSDSIDITEDR